MAGNRAHAERAPDPAGCQRPCRKGRCWVCCHPICKSHCGRAGTLRMCAECFEEFELWIGERTVARCIEEEELGEWQGPRGELDQEEAE